jgi:XTP/dITP diphosphohydrolase
LGDVLLHLVFYAKIGSEKESFDIADVINSLNEKLIFRHPHIYGDTVADDEETVKQNWEKLKLKGNKSNFIRCSERFATDYQSLQNPG